MSGSYIVTRPEEICSVLWTGKRQQRVDLVPSICHNDLNYLKEYIDKRGRENNDD
jgi:hypothetical protein